MLNDPATPADVDIVATLCAPERITPWLDEQGLQPGKQLHIERIIGGQSNEMFRLRRGDKQWVLRRPSAVALPRAAEGLRREFRFLTALEATPVPHPAPIRECTDESVIGAAFYVMANIDGWRSDVHGIAKMATNDSDRAEFSYALVDALAELHKVDYVAVGLADLGRVNDFHERQVERWAKQLRSYEGRELPGFDQLGAWLNEHRPGSFTPTIMHGDYHTMNVLITHQRPWRVAGILDWETCTIGDPLLDLGAFLRSFGRENEPGWPSWAALVERYSEQTGRDVENFPYYLALSRFRLAVLLEGIFQRSLRDPTREPRTGIGNYASQLILDALRGVGAEFNG